MNVIEVTDLTKRYGGRTAVDGVSFSVEEGEIFGILGPNGAGKTTTVETHRRPSLARRRHDQRAGPRPPHVTVTRLRPLWVSSCRRASSRTG